MILINMFTRSNRFGNYLWR